MISSWVVAARDIRVRAAGSAVPSACVLVQLSRGLVALCTQYLQHLRQGGSRGAGAQGLRYLQQTYKRGVRTAEHVWRYVLLGALFGMLGLSSLVAGCLTLTGRLPRLTALSVFVLWVHTTLIVLIGLGNAPHSPAQPVRAWAFNFHLPYP